MARRHFPPAPDLRRGGPRRSPKLRVYIYAEGKNTEPFYFESFAEEHGNSLVHVSCEGGEGVPATLVDKAHEQLRVIRRSGNSFERGDQVWVVFDEDEHPQVRQSINRARSLGILVGYSNPCFEVWLLIHHMDHDAPDDRHAVQKKLAGADKGYDPKGSKRPTYQDLSANYDTAKARAARMRKTRENERNAGGCPYTDIDLLTEIIVKNGKRNRP